MPTLHWIGKDKVINHHMDVPFRVLEHNYGFANGNQLDEETGSGNKIIHGDNLEALKSLLPEYEGKINCIYIDPPYNTGNENWVYNDNVNDPKIKKWLGQVVGRESEDLSRHDKWLCMMYPRLKLLHKLLADDGAFFISIDGDLKEGIMAYILDPARKDSRVKNFTRRIMDIIGNMYPIPDKEIEKYLSRILEDFTDEQFNDFANNEYTYTDKIKQKIKAHSETFAEKKFKDFLDTDKVFIKPSFVLPKSISPGDTAKDISKSLYEKEGSMNPYEERIINEIGNMNNIAFWTRNIERKGFRINGFINHYPDFIIQTKSGKTIVLETKGDHLDAEQKIRLGNLWASKAGNSYRYFMVYERRTVDGAYKLEDFWNLIKEI